MEHVSASYYILLREPPTVKPTTDPLRYHEREIFRENRFLGLPNGIAAAGPAALTTLVCLRLSLTHADVLTWLLPGIVYLVAYALLVAHLPDREVLRQLARQALHEEIVRKSQQLELRFEEAEDVEWDDHRYSGDESTPVLAQSA
ncbi:hypothetical protein SAMN02745148_03737 [Modicisalibacter ilicicola DSM 19980]|uniref:Uncharacterized protein n=1 Tax=Modicisalibacter ilicicola DSM 19980 TaxID=1121942 RepID=A0A1M5F8Y8_9GAMM|nr:hypothetical protein [Halomonas ilicicola]SHF87531.1 hypothetical protein SAMN02745148_03737 [Halomonas ilicicola DSM 19980]